VQEVNQLLKQWSEMNKMMGKMRQMMGSGKKGRHQMRQMMRQMGMDPNADYSKFNK
jgi:signal recognition particle subunit SRP54